MNKQHYIDLVNINITALQSELGISKNTMQKMREWRNSKKFDDSMYFNHALNTILQIMEWVESVDADAQKDMMRSLTMQSKLFEEWQANAK